MESQYLSSEYKRSRKAYITQCTLEHLIGLLVADAFLAKLLYHLGLNDALIGIISSFTSIAFVFQLTAIYIAKSNLSTKKAVIISDGLSQLFFMLLYLIPFFPVSAETKKLLVILSVFVGYAGKYVILTLYFKWANTYVHPKNRGVFSANKEVISLICGIIFVSVMGYFVDKFDSIGNLRGGFIFIASAMLIINILNFLSLLMIKDEDAAVHEASRIPFRNVIKHIYKNKLYFRYILSIIPSSIAGGLLTGFMGIYKTKDLMLSILTIQLINISADFTRIIFSKPFGRFSDKYGFARGIELSDILILLCFITIIFTTPKTRYLIIIYTVLFSVSTAGSYQNSFNIGYTLLPQEYMTQASAIKSVVSGLVSFGSAVLAGKILNYIQFEGNMIFGIHIYGQQFLAIIASIFKIVAIIILHYTVVKPIEQQNLKSK